MTIKQNKIIADALRHYGPEAQMNQVNEECGELIVALSHFRRNKCSRTDVITEIADVMIMCEQMRLLFGEDAVDGQIESKLNRLQYRMATPRPKFNEGGAE